VVFPDCRGPVRVTTGYRVARSRRMGSRRRGCMQPDESPIHGFSIHLKIHEILDTSRGKIHQRPETFVAGERRKQMSRCSPPSRLDHRRTTRGLSLKRMTPALPMAAAARARQEPARPQGAGAAGLLPSNFVKPELKRRRVLLGLVPVRPCLFCGNLIP
jgi:hypothetical protein